MHVEEILARRKIIGVLAEDVLKTLACGIRNSGEITEACNVNENVVAEKSHVNGSRLAVDNGLNRLLNLVGNADRVSEVVCRAHGNIADGHIVFKLNNRADGFF